MRTLVIGDVHGCKDELIELIDQVQPDETVLVGDLFTKGPKPAGVYKAIRRGEMRAVCGNHDQRLLDALDGKRADDAHAHKCIARLDKTGPEWRTWLRELPLTLDVAGWTVVHAGLHPSGKKKRTTQAIAQLRRRWPTDRAPSPHWHQVYWGKRKVIFGHDALSGLVRVERDREPWVIGLDTGCVYGRQLSGYLIEEDRLVQVDAHRVYRPVNR